MTIPENMAWKLRRVVEHSGSCGLRGGPGFKWGEAPSKIAAQMASLQRRGLVEITVKDRSTTFAATELAKVAVACENLGRAVKRFAFHLADERRTTASRKQRRTALVKRCESWLDERNDGFGHLIIDGELLATFIESLSAAAYEVV